MKVAVVVPWIPAVKGISLAITIAKYLSKSGASVEFVAHTTDIRFKSEISSMLGQSVAFLYLNESSNEKLSRLNYLRYQYLSNIDKELAEYLSKEHRDLVLIVSDEGHNIAKLLKKHNWSDEREAPVIGLLVQELIEYSFMPSIYPSLSLLRMLLSPLKHVFHKIEKKRFQAFDFFYANSEWTALNLKKLYSFNSRLVVSIIDDELYPKIDTPWEQREGIIVPTASLDRTNMEVIKNLSREGIKITAYGKKIVPGVKNLGFLPRNKMVEVISRAKAMLFLFDYEALGLIPIESIMIGTPVITEAKQGPFYSLKDCNCVKFAREYSELLSICKELQEVNNLNMLKCRTRGCSSRFSASKNADRIYNDLSKLCVVDS